MGLIKKLTTLIDTTTDVNYIYIGKTRVSGNVSPSINEEIWEIIRITLVDGKPTKIENGINKDNRAYLAWNKRTIYNYI